MNKKILTIIGFILILITISGCSSDKTIVLTTGLKDDQIFQVEDQYCTKKEVMIYLTNIQNSYESVYGENIWDTDTGDVTLEESLKETVLARISRVKVLKLMAEEKGLELDKNQKDLAEAAAKEYYNSLNDEEKKLLAADVKTITKMYEDYCIAEELYNYLIKDVNPEISDDEARSVTVQEILVKTYHEDREGNITPFSDENKQNAYMMIKEARAKYEMGESFDNLILTYNQDSKSSLTFRRGQADSVIEEVAFNMDSGQVSDIFETDEGYMLLRCTSSFNKDETELNRQEMLKERREEAFYAEYEDFLNGLTGNLNEKSWEAITLIHEDSVKTSSFFDIYEEYFVK